MKLSKILHVLSVVAGVIGIVSYANERAVVYLLIAIWFTVGAIHHMKLEEKGQLI